MNSVYGWVEAVHIISVIFWMAALLYIPRLFVYHAKKSNTSEINKTFQQMEKRLLLYIATPAMVFAVAAGSVLATYIGWFKVGLWFHLKFLFVIIMLIFHHYLYYCRKKLIKNPQWKSEKFFRIMNEIPAILVILIVIMVVVRPFS